MIVCPSCQSAVPDDKAACPSCGFSPTTVEGFTAWAPEMAHAGGGFKRESFAHLAELEASNFWFRARNALIVWALQRYAPKMASFLEIGCGTGFVLSGVAQAFPQARLVGSEIFVDGLAHAATRLPDVELVQMDARRIPYREAFDVVAVLDVIEHIEEDELVLRQMLGALRPGGTALISVPQHQWLWSKADDYACHVRRYSAGEVHRKVKAAGFEIVRSTSFVSVLLPAMMASRLAARRTSTFDPRKEFEIPPAINSAFEASLAFERGIIRAGINFPIGGSRFVVARRPHPERTICADC
ncbi:MAG: methyltransferase domain-containing protein [Rhizobiaceae bacterium]|nr:methyltransferase domain-containing protein [Rhizobiaceae bacterium]